jgi:hypothetical protein
MLSVAGTMESSMSKAGLDNRHRNKDGEISGKHGNTLIRTLRKVCGQRFRSRFVDAVPSEVFDYERQHKLGATATSRKIIEVQRQSKLIINIFP